MESLTPAQIQKESISLDAKIIGEVMFSAVLHYTIYGQIVEMTLFFSLNKGSGLGEENL